MKLIHKYQRNQERFARGLGLFGIALGTLEFAATRRLSRGIGISERHRTVVRGMGFREIANGAAILANPRDPRLMWGRVAGDALDLSLLGLALTSRGAKRGRVIAAAGAVAGAAILDVLCGLSLSRPTAQRVTRRRLSGGRGVRIQKSLAINCPAEHLYRFSRDLSNLPRFVKNLRSVEELAGKRLRWTFNTARGGQTQWDTEITEDEPGQLIAWRSVDNGIVEHGGSIRFLQGPQDRGTIARLELRWRSIAAGVGPLLGVTQPDFYVGETLRQLKAIVETGEIPTTRGQSSGRRVASVDVETETGNPMGLRALLAR
jgi:uncharacterized membrane protein